MLKEPNRMYGVAAEIKPPFKLDDKLVIQYESTLTDGLTCGGAYVKLLEAPVDTSKFDNESPYVFMFGPDRCGATDKVHFIVRQKNPKSNTWYEHHLRDAPRAKADRSPHLYKAVINNDDTFAIYIDDEEAFSGSLMDALEPPRTTPNRRTGSTPRRSTTRRRRSPTTGTRTRRGKLMMRPRRCRRAGSRTSRCSCPTRRRRRPTTGTTRRTGNGRRRRSPTPSATRRRAAAPGRRRRSTILSIRASGTRPRSTTRTIKAPGRRARSRTRSTSSRRTRPKI